MKKFNKLDDISMHDHMQNILEIRQAINTHTSSDVDAECVYVHIKFGESYFSFKAQVKEDLRELVSRYHAAGYEVLRLLRA